MGEEEGFSAAVAVPTPNASSGTSRAAPGSLRGTTDVPAGVRGVGGSGSACSLRGRRDAAPSRSPKPVDGGAVSPCQGGLVGRVMGQGETGLRKSIQLSRSEKRVGFAAQSTGCERSKKPVLLCLGLL